MTLPRRLAVGLVAGAAFVLLLLALPTAPAHSYSSGAPDGFSGPEQYCNACHGGAAENPVNSGPGEVDITAPTTFVAGEVVPITVTVTPQGAGLKQGFELSARDADLNHVGTFNVDGTTVQFSPGSTAFVTHTSSSNTGTSWTFEWVAPVEPPGAVTFYAAGNASNGNFAPDAGDEIYTAEHVLALTTANEPDAPALAFRLDAPFPNPLPMGGSATASYVLDRAADVTALVRDGRGRVVRVLERGPRAAGPHALRLAADGLAAGTYFLALSTPEGTQVRPFAVVR